MLTREQRELAQQARQKELDQKLELLYGKSVFISLREGRVKSLTDLRLTLTAAELEAVMPLLHLACLDVDAINRNGYSTPKDPAYVLGYRYPRFFPFGDEASKRYGLIQILI